MGGEEDFDPSAEIGVAGAFPVEQGVPRRRVRQVEGGGEQVLRAAGVGGHGGVLRGVSLNGAKGCRSVSRNSPAVPSGRKAKPANGPILRLKRGLGRRTSKAMPARASAAFQFATDFSHSRT